jgi:hypothetical protein
MARVMNQGDERVFIERGRIGKNVAECEFIRVVVEVKAAEAQSGVVVNKLLDVYIFVFGYGTDSSKSSVDGVLPGTVG